MVNCNSDATVPPSASNAVTTPLKKVSSYSGDFQSYVGAAEGGGGAQKSLSRHDSGTSSGSFGDTANYTAGEYRPLHERIRKRIENNDLFFSLEFFPAKTANGVVNFFNRLDRLNEGGPEFIDVTWHMGSDPGNVHKETSSTSVAAGCLNYCRVDTMLHITCAQYNKEQTMHHIKQTKDVGMRNIMALRGDLPPTEENETVLYKFRALDMVRWIKEEYNDYFTIAVSGYPSGHPEAPSYDADIRYLKAKVDAGAHLIVTQLFFEVDVYEKFVHDCREIGITCPIIPGILPIQSYDNIVRVCQLSKLTIPQFVLDALEPIKNNDEAVRKYGVDLAVSICRRLLSNGTAPSVHVYTLNREAAARSILQQIGLWQKHNVGKTLPWKPHVQHPTRCREDVRPIFWSARPKSYIFRTKDWDDFPNGRWGNSSSPAFGDLKDYYLFYLVGQKPKEQQRKAWGLELKSETDVWKVFVNFLSGEKNENGVKVTQLPWSEVGGLSGETVLIKDQLLWANQNGILTINSQPAVNGAPSSDPIVGWGEPGGYTYQKAYLEFFTRRKNAIALLKVLKQFPRVTYHVVDSTGELDVCSVSSVTAVTWAVFAGREIAQPTVVDPQSFRIWKDEAYDEWTKTWAAVYDENSHSRRVLQRIHDGYCLVMLVDNDFPTPSCLWQLLDAMLDEANTMDDDDGEGDSANQGHEMNGVTVVEVEEKEGENVAPI